MLKRYKAGRATLLSMLGWVLFATGLLGFIWGLFKWQPIMNNLELWGINTLICTTLVWFGWGFSHYYPEQIWRDYIWRTLKPLLALVCMAVIVYTAWMLFTRIIELEVGLAISVIALTVLWLLGWIAEHKVWAGLMLLPLIVSVLMVIFPVEAQRILTILSGYTAIMAVVGIFTLLNPLSLIFFLGGIAFIIWVIVSIVRG